MITFHSGEGTGQQGAYEGAAKVPAGTGEAAAGAPRRMARGPVGRIRRAVFEEFVDDPKHYTDRRWTHVIEPFEIPDGWTICRSYDFGYGKPFSCAWWAVDYDGTIYRIMELYGCTRTPNEGVKWTPDKQFEEIHKTEMQHPWLKGKTIIGVADPAIWDASRGESVADTAARYGVFLRLATMNALQVGCSATTGCSLTRMDIRGCMSSTPAGRSSGRSRR